MSAELQWMLIRDANCFLVRRNGIAFSREPTNVAKKHSYKYCGLVQPSLCIQPTADGVAMTRRSRHAGPHQVAKAYPAPVVTKKSATGGPRALKVAKDMQSTGFRLDLVRAAQARVCALLAATKPRKTFTKTLRANKLAKLTKNN